MKIAFDAKRAFLNNSGLGNYSRGVITCLNKYYPELELHLISPKPKNNLAKHLAETNQIHFFSGLFKNIKRVTHSVKLSENLDIDIFHGLSNELPKGLDKSSIKSIVTIHDLIFLKFPEFYKKVDRNIYLAKTKHAIANSDLIITTSNQTKDDLESYFGMGHKCKTVYQHVSQFELSDKTTDNLPSTPYLLYISSFERRKNHLNLLNAFNGIKDKTQNNLILIGRPRETYKEVESFITKHHLGKRVTLLPNAKIADIKKYLENASGFIYPSLYEGFGIPLIEAMHYSLPIACSNIPVFNEIAKKHANYFDPLSITEISNGILKLCETSFDVKKKNDINQHLKLFSAEQHAFNLMQCYKTL